MILFNDFFQLSAYKHLSDEIGSGKKSTVGKATTSDDVPIQQRNKRALGEFEMVWKKTTVDSAYDMVGCNIILITWSRSAYKIL